MNHTSDTKLDKSSDHLIWIPFFLILYNFCVNLSNDIYLPSLPKLVTLFSSSISSLQLTVTAWFAGVACPQLFFGPLTDRYGRRPVLLAGGIIFLLASLWCALSNNVLALIMARFFQGVGVSSINVCSFGILTDLYTYKKRTQIMNKINMWGNLAPLLGPIIGGYIFKYYGWRTNFLFILMLGLICLLGLWKKLPESNSNLNPKALKFKNITRNYWLLIRNKSFLQHLLPYCLILGGLIVYITSAPFIVIEKLGVPPEYFGYAQLPIFITFISGSLYLNYAADESKIKVLLSRGIIIIFIAGILLITSNFFLENNLYSFIIPMVIYALGFSLCASPLTSEVMASAGTAKGSGAAILGFGMAMSCMLSSFLLGLIYNGTIVSIACLIFLISTLATYVYFLPSDISVETERAG